jgi:hypothetical protein
MLGSVEEGFHMLSEVMVAAVGTGVVAIAVAVAGDAPPGMSRSAEISTTPKGE